MIEATGMQTLAAVEYRLPNFATNASPLTGFTARYIRGVNAASRNVGFDSGYAVFVDGVYSGRYMSAERMLTDVSRIEYMPGPQGTLFGKNTTLGVVNIVTEKPDPYPSGNLVVGVGNEGQRSIKLSGSTPITDNWVAVGAYTQRERDGWVENIHTGATGNNTDTKDARIALHGDIGNTSVSIAADYYKSTPDLIVRQRLEGVGALPAYTASNDFDGSQEDEDKGVNVTLKHDFGFGQVTSITAYRDTSTSASLDDDAWELPVQHLLDWSESSQQFSQEFRLNVDMGDFSYLAGIYYLDQQTESERTVLSVLGQLQVDGDVDSRYSAVFGNVGYQMSERVKAELGLRYTHETKDLNHYSQDGGGVLLSFTTKDDRSEGRLTASASLSFEASDAVTLFTRYAQGYKSGGFNVDIVTSPVLSDLAFDDEQTESFEVGAKTRWLDGRLALDLTAFHTTYDDLQVSQFEVLPGALLPTLRITNAASAHTQGVEAGAELLLQKWLFSTRVGYTHSEVDDFPDPLGPGTGNWKGSSLGGPEWTTSSMAQYSTAIGSGTDLTITAEHLFQDKIGGDLNDDPRNLSDSLSLVNLSLELAFGKERQWRTRLWVNNVFETEQVVERRQNPAAGILALIGLPPEIQDSTVGMYNLPRTYGLEVSLRLN
jgi:iron complex outermembrane receptor protein